MATTLKRKILLTLFLILTLTLALILNLYVYQVFERLSHGKMSHGTSVGNVGIPR